MRVVRPRKAPDLPSVTVVIPCYRYGMFLEEAVGAVLGQDGVDPRVIIVDDASPDDSASVAHALAAADSRVTVVVHETNKGHIQTYNARCVASGVRAHAHPSVRWPRVRASSRILRGEATPATDVPSPGVLDDLGWT
jgi:cellulose synthase/poly-beta-1,6-N-acetylglucosamine synthase-like glycosyltransferase